MRIRLRGKLPTPRAHCLGPPPMRVEALSPFGEWPVEAPFKTPFERPFLIPPPLSLTSPGVMDRADAPKLKPAADAETDCDLMTDGDGMRDTVSFELLVKVVAFTKWAPYNKAPPKAPPKAPSKAPPKEPPKAPPKANESPMKESLGSQSL